ncbi:glycosyltransferase family 4 protein [Nocardioides solisilvae]|uniref:glycosyltransferase family 4 protein n=1 Tax=Nocardioides solisilvae TaxID=1542435 RepID=UPI0013A52CA9|nr:glycosyltransferase family 1 protein [Nocardioides solisilvae]
MGVSVNGYFRAQTVSGQQRYATEIAARLLTTDPTITELHPRLTGRAAWLDLMTRLPLRARGDVLVSLTSRAPVGVKRHVVTVHDLFPLEHPEWYSRAYVELHRRLLRHHLQHAAGLVVVSEPVRDQVAAVARRGMPIVVAPNAPSADLVPPDGHQPTFEVPERFILTVGSLEPRKNLVRLVTAYRQLPADFRAEHPLLVAGGSAASFRQVPGLAELTDGASGVRLLDRVSDEDLACLYRDASVFTSVSLAEGFGIPVVEAAASMTGTLLLSDIPAYRWLAPAGSAVFADPTSVDEISASLLRAATTPGSPASLRELAGRFSWDDSAATVLELARAL